MKQPSSQRTTVLSTVSWILYDFANTAYSMNVVSLYFSTWIVNELAQSDFWVSLVNSVSMALVAVTMPVLGEWSDKKNKKILALFVFTMLCITGTFAIGFFGKNISAISLLVPIVLLLYVIANYSYQGGLVFYNSLLPSVSTPKNLGRVSGYGVAIGYMGSAAGLIVGSLFVQGSIFGLTIPGITAGGRAAAFMPTAFLFLIFAVPLFLFVREPRVLVENPSWKIRDSYKRVWSTIASTQKYPGLRRFLIANFLCEDSIQTIIIFMGVYTQAVMGFSSKQTEMFFLFVIPAAVVGSVIAGILTDHYGPKKTLVGVIMSWLACLVVLISTMNATIFWILGATVGILLGSTWTAARPLLVTLVPRENLGEFFGLYALSGKAAAIIGPLLWSTVTLLLASRGDVIKYKAAIGLLVVVIAGGLAVLWRVPDRHKEQKFQTDVSPRP